MSLFWFIYVKSVLDGAPFKCVLLKTFTAESFMGTASFETTSSNSQNKVIALA